MDIGTYWDTYGMQKKIEFEFELSYLFLFIVGPNHKLWDTAVLE